MGLLFINALKGLKKKKIQIIAIIALIMLSTGIYTALNTSLDRAEERYYDYLIEQNVEEFSFMPIIDYKKDITSLAMTDLLKTNFKETTSDEKQILDQYLQCLKTNCVINDTSFYTYVESIFNKYQADLVVAKEKIDTIAQNYKFSYEVEVAKVLKEGKYLYKAMPYDANKKINKPYLLAGRFPQADKEITVLRDFALKNDLVMGDNLKINDKEYKIVGYAFAADHIYPLLSVSVPFFDNKYNNIIFMNDNTYRTFSGLNEIVLSAKFNNNDSKNRVDFTMDDNDAKSNNPISLIFDEQKEHITLTITSMLRFARTDMIKSAFAPNRIFAEAFLYLLLGISVFVISIVTKKRIDDERLQIGVLKSLGYNSLAIAISYLVYPVIGSLVGGMLGYLIGILLNNPITNIFIGYYNVPVDNFTLNLGYLYKDIFIPMVILSFLCYFIALFMLRKKPLYLLKEGSNLKVNIFSKLVTLITKPLPFKSRFKYSLAFRSLGKLLIVSFTSLSVGLLIVLNLIGANLFNSMIDKTFDNVKYDYIINYYTLRTDNDADADMLLEVQQKILGIIDKNNAYKDLTSEEFNVYLTGIDDELKYLALNDTNGKNLLPKLKDRNVVINANVKEMLGINVGDKIVFEYNNQKLEYLVVGVIDEFFANNIYINRLSLSSEYGIDLAYNKKYSKDIKYSTTAEIDSNELREISNIIDFIDLKRNIEERIKVFNLSIYIVIVFAAIMALIIIAVIANIVVEENKKTISLMKVIGYKNKEISKIVLNIYTPFVVIFYLISIPIMISLLKVIVKSITNDIEMAIPIEISPFMAGVGLVALVSAYYIAIAISRKVLNKVPLAVALKRE